MRPLSQLLNNFHWIVPGEAARSAQSFTGFWGPFVSANGIKAVINLRGHHPEFAWWRREARICRARGVAHFDAMLDSRLLPTRAMLVALMAAFDAAPRPLLIKCSGGQDRTSFAAALYLVHQRGWNALPDALAQFARLPYLHFPKAQQHWLRHFPVYAQEAAGTLTLRAWLVQRYDPGAFSAWLDQQGLQESYRGIYPAG